MICSMARSVERSCSTLRRTHTNCSTSITKQPLSRPGKHQRNLADDPRHAAKRSELEGLLLDQQRTFHDPYRLGDQPADDLTLPKLASPPQKTPKKQTW